MVGIPRTLVQEGTQKEKIRLLLQLGFEKAAKEKAEAAIILTLFHNASL